MSSSTRPFRPAGLALAAAVLTVTLAAACGPDPSSSGNANHAPAAAPTATGLAASAATQPKTVQIDKTAYWGGLRFDVKSAAYKPVGGGGYQVVLDTTVTNTFRTYAVNDWPSFSIDIAGTPLTPEPSTAVPPTPGASNPLTLTFSGYGGKPFGFDGASFVLGDPGVAQAVVPLGQGGRDAISLKPIELTLPANPSLTSGELSVTLKSAQLRADFGDGNGVTALKRGQRALLVIFDMTGHPGPAGMNVSGENFGLKLPSGEEVGPTRAPIEALYPDRPGRQDQAAWFVFEGATDGGYTLSVTDQPAAPATASFNATAVKDSGPLS